MCGIQWVFWDERRRELLRAGVSRVHRCRSNQAHFKQGMLEDPCSLASPGSVPHWQVLQVQNIRKFSLLLCSSSHPLWQPLCFTVLPGWLAQGLLLASTLLGVFLLAAVSMPLSTGTSTRKVRKLTFLFIIIAAVLSLAFLPGSTLWTPIYSYSLLFFQPSTLTLLPCSATTASFCFSNTVLKFCMLWRTEKMAGFLTWLLLSVFAVLFKKEYWQQNNHHDIILQFV